MDIGAILLNLWADSGFAAIASGFTSATGWQSLIMLVIACVLLYLAIVKKFEPLLLVGIAFGCLLTNLPNAGLYHQVLWDAFMDPTDPGYHSFGQILREGGLLDIFYIGVKASLYPCLIFMGVGAMTDFGALPRSWACLPPSSVEFALASPARRLPPSALSAALTDQQRFS